MLKAGCFKKQPAFFFAFLQYPVPLFCNPGKNLTFENKYL